MALSRYDPLRTLSQLQSEMNRLFDHRLEGEESATPSAAVASDWSPPVDVAEDTDQYMITADVPGVDPDSIEVTLENGILTLRGERQPEQSEEELAKYKRMERVRGTFYRRFTLPDTADSEKVQARCRNGVLAISIPKQERVQPRKIEVES